jgi:hypothetical protein
MNIKQPKKNQVAAVRWIVLLALATGLFANAQSTDDSTGSDFRTFEIIVQRNIFDPNRYPHSSSHHTRTFHGVPTFSLAGTMSYRKGMFAFFNGTSDEYQKALQEGGTINGYTVAKINFDGVQLKSGDKTISLKVGAAMQRQGDNWELAAPGEWTDESSTSQTDTDTQNTNEIPAANPAAGGGADSDVLKRLMQQRAQETK